MRTPSGGRRPIRSPRTPRTTRRAGDGAAPRLSTALALGVLAFIITPAAPALVGQSFALRGLFAGGIIGLVSGARIPILAGVVTAVAAVLVGELVFAIVPMPFSFTRALITLGLAAGAVASVMVMSRRGWERIAASTLLLIVLLGHLWISGTLPGPYRDATGRLLSTLRHEPVAGRYDFDGDIYLRTYFMMKRGGAFYPSFATACAEDARQLGVPRGKLNYREPFLFELWRMLPGRDGVSLRNWFLAFVALVMVCGFHLARTFTGPGPALLAPIALGGYFATAAWSGWFLFAELWAGGVAVMAALALVRGRWHVAAVLIAVAVAFRELMVFLVPALAVGWALCRKPRAPWTALAAGLTLPFLPLAYHLVAAPAVPGAPAFDLSAWLHGGFGQLVESLRFSSNFIPLGPGLQPWAPVPALVGAALARPGWRAGFLLSALGLALIGLGTFSAGRYGLYWGAILQPLALALVAVAARPINDRSS